MPAKYRVEITRTAEADLGELWEHIAADSIEVATEFILQIEERVLSLDRIPLRCPAIPENRLLGTDYRHLILKDYRVVFRIDGSTVYILRILHGNRLLDSSFFGKE